MARLTRYLKSIGLASLVTGGALGIFVAVRTDLWNGILAGVAGTAGLGTKYGDRLLFRMSRVKFHPEGVPWLRTDVADVF